MLRPPIIPNIANRKNVAKGKEEEEGDGEKRETENRWKKTHGRKKTSFPLSIPIMPRMIHEILSFRLCARIRPYSIPFPIDIKQTPAFDNGITIDIQINIAWEWHFTHVSNEMVHLLVFYLDFYALKIDWMGVQHATFE